MVTYRGWLPFLRSPEKTGNLIYVCQVRCEINDRCESGSTAVPACSLPKWYGCPTVFYLCTMHFTRKPLAYAVHVIDNFCLPARKSIQHQIGGLHHSWSTEYESVRTVSTSLYFPKGTFRAL